MNLESWIAYSSFERDLEPDFPLDDFKYVYSEILEEEEVCENKKRRLLGTSTEIGKCHEGQSNIQSLIKSYIPESYIRNDDESLENIRQSIEKAINPYTDMTENDTGEVITEEPPTSPATSTSMDLLSEILIKASKSNSDATFVTSCISELVTLLEDLPSQALIAMEKKLKGEAATLQFTASFPCRRILLINRLTKQFQRSLSKVKHVNQLPASISKALSIACLSAKAKTRNSEILTTIFSNFFAEVKCLQNEIMEAIWIIDEIKPRIWKQLNDIFSLKFDFSPRFFKKSFYNYLMEHLFFCDDQWPPDLLFEALKIINRGIQPQLSTNQMEEQLESVLHVSCQLREIVWESLPSKDADLEYARYTESLGCKDSSTIEIIDMDCSLFAIHDFTKTPVFDSVIDGIEGSGDSMPDKHAVKNVDLKKNDHESTSEATNWYQELVTISDEASMAVYRVINVLLDKLMREEGSSISVADLLLAIGEINPPLPRSVVERFENFLRC